MAPVGGRVDLLMMDRGTSVPESWTNVEVAPMGGPVDFAK